MAPPPLKSVTHRWLLAALIQRQRREGGGYSMPMVMVIALILVVGGVALASRANQGLLGAIFQNQSWEARSAAEIGMNRIISELNKERNRWLMVKRTGDSEQIWTRPSAGGTVETLRTNPCEPEIRADYSKLDPNNAASSTYGTWYVDGNGNVSSSSAGATKAYRLVRVTRQEFYRSGTTQALSPFLDRGTGTGTLVLAVQGQKLKSNGTAVASVTLEKTFELVPKCCKVSFGGEHGGLNYAIDSGTKESLCTNPTQLGLGLLFGAKDNNTGSITVNGKSVSIADYSGTPIDPIYCIASSTTGCTVDRTIADRVAIIDQDLPPAKIYPGSASSKGAITPDDFTTYDSANFLYKICNGGLPGSGKCSNSDERYVINGGAASGFPSFCTSTTSTVHCNLTYLDYKGIQLIFLTGSKKIWLYFPDGPANTATTVIRNAGMGQMKHCLTINSTTAECLTSPQPFQITNLALFGRNPSSSSDTGSQSVEMYGTADALRLFSYFPTGTFKVVGNSTFEGISWSNRIDTAGNTTWTVPGSGLASVLEMMEMIPSGAGGSTSNALLTYDFIARATNRYRWI